MPWHHHGIAAPAAAIHRIGRGENIRRRDARGADALQLGCQHIEQHLGIGAGIEVAAILAHQYLGELARVGEIAVMAQTKAVRRVHVERLCVVRTVGAGGGVADMPNANVAPQLEHVLLLKHIAHQSRILAHEELAVQGGHDARGILAAVLQNSQRIVDALVDRAHTHHSNDSAHARPPP
jgi:hypothetical protein